MKIKQTQSMDFHEINKIAFMSSIELVLMRKGEVDYNMVVSKLRSIYNCEVIDCFEHQEYLQKVLKEVFNKDYNSVVDEISSKTKGLVNMNKFKASFFKVMTT